MYKILGSTIKKRWIGDDVKIGTWAALCVDGNEVCLKVAENGNIALGQLTGIMQTTGDPSGPPMAVVDCSYGLKLTDRFDTTQGYPVNAKLFVVDGELTTNEESAKFFLKDGEELLAIGFVVDPPSAIVSVLTYYRYG